jgi:tetratricopeptide (TPR) repeat protein
MSRLDTLLQLQEQSPQDAFILYALATEYGKAYDWDRCIHWFRHLEASHPDYVGLYYHLGKALEKTDNIEAAVDVYRKGISVAGRVGDGHAQSELRGALIQWEDE